MGSRGQYMLGSTQGRSSIPQQQLPFVFPYPTLRSLRINRSEDTAPYESQAVEDLLLNREMHLAALGEFRLQKKPSIGAYFKVTEWRVRACYPHLLVGM